MWLPQVNSNASQAVVLTTIDYFSTLAIKVLIYRTPIFDIRLI
jgi:hypothetical protein